jgi:hypothetical protein
MFVRNPWVMTVGNDSRVAGSRPIVGDREQMEQRRLTSENSLGCTLVQPGAMPARAYHCQRSLHRLLHISGSDPVLGRP